VGVVRRQSIWNTIVISLGFLLGGITYSIILPRALSLEQIGLIQLQLSIANILAIVACLGLPGALAKFFPYYRHNPPKLRYFFFYLSGILTLILILIVILYVLFKPIFVAIYGQKSPLYIHYYFGVIPMLCYIAIYHYMDQLASLLYKSVLISVFRDLVSRLFMMLGAVMVLFSLWDFEQFYWFYLLSFWILVFLVFFSISLSEWKELTTGVKEFIPWGERRKWLIYALVTFFSGAAVVVLQNVDKVMLGAFTNLDEVGVYGIYSSLAIVLYLPSRGALRIARVEIVEAWADQDLSKMGRLYQRLSLILFASGSLIWLLLLHNQQFLFWLVKKEAFRDSFGIFVWVSLAFLIDILGGANSLILATSSIYRWDFYLNLLLVVSNVILNFLFIPLWGGLGAALATFCSYTFLNVLRIYLLWHYYRLHPFVSNHFFIGLLILITYGFGYILPNWEQPIVNMVFRSLVIGSFFVGNLLLFRMVPDFNDFLMLLYRKFILRK